MRRNHRILCAEMIWLCVVLLYQASASARPPEWPETLVFGVTPAESPQSVQQRMEGLVRYLEAVLDCKISLLIPEHYSGVIAGLAANTIDFAHLGPNAYVEATRQAEIEAFVRQVLPDGTPGYYSLILTRRDSGLTSIDQLKGKTWAFTDPESTSGALIPRVYLQVQQRLDLDTYFARVTYSGSHEASILAVKNREVDAASTNNINLERGVTLGKWTADEFTMLWTSPLIPGSPTAYRKALPESLKTALKQAFLDFHDPATLALLATGGYIATTDAEYDFIRSMVAFEERFAEKKQTPP